MPPTGVHDAEGNVVIVGDEVAFYFSEARVLRGRVARISQTVWEQRQNPTSGFLHIELEPGGTKYKRRANAVILLSK